MVAFSQSEVMVAVGTLDLGVEKLHDFSVGSPSEASHGATENVRILQDAEFANGVLEAPGERDGDIKDRRAWHGSFTVDFLWKTTVKCICIYIYIYIHIHIDR